MKLAGEGRIVSTFRHAFGVGDKGQVAEWLKAHAWKACRR